MKASTTAMHRLAKPAPLRAGGALLCGLLMATAATGFTLEFPGPATPTANQAAERASYPLPTGRWEKSGLPTRIIEGMVERAAWRIDVPELTSLDLMKPLRAQLIGAGFQPLFECETEGCGGFDFRFATDVLPEPDMHVDLGDFRFLSAERKTSAGEEAIGLLVSRSYSKGFVQITRAITDAPVETGQMFAATNKVTDEFAPIADGLVTFATSNRPPLLPTRGAAMAHLVTGGAVVLEGLRFDIGSTDLTEGRYNSLTELAEWLKENPDKTVALVGHTDASGGLETNIAISKRRAESVRARLINVHGTPSKQIEAQGVGYLSPVDTNLTEEGRQKNRRVEAILTSTQ